MKSKPQEPLTTEQRSQIATLSAGGWSTNKISKHIGRSRHAVRNVLAEPEIRRAVSDEKAELAELYKTQARAIVASIDQKTIDKANLLQRMTSAGIATDKALLLTGEPTANLNIAVLMEVVDAIRAKRDAESERRFLEAKQVNP